MQHILNIIDPSTEDGLISVADMKKILNIQPTDTSKDEGLGLLIDAVSIQMAVLVNRRTFGIEKVEETFYEIENSKRLYFSKWPVKFDDIQELTFQGTDILTSTDWVLVALRRCRSVAPLSLSHSVPPRRAMISRKARVTW